MRRSLGLVSGLVAWTFAVSVQAQTPGVAVNVPLPVTPVSVTPLPSGANVRPFGFAHLFIKLPPNKAWQSNHVGIFCLAGPKAVWKNGQQELKNSAFLDVIRSEVTSAGFKLDGDPNNLFEPTASASDLQVGAVVTDADFDTCMLYVGYGNADTIKGRAMLKIEWQIYSSIQKTVLAKVETEQTVEMKNSGPGGIDGMFMAALRENARAFIASPDFQKAFTGTAPPPGELVKPVASATVLHLAGAKKAKVTALSDAVGSVVMVSAGVGQGSAFLVSSDGYLLTDKHVVGDAQYVKVRWPDGIEALGEVVRSDKVRDVALIKTDSRGRQPLALRRDPLQPGDTVFAIGTPLGEKFQSTMTRGIVSAYRTFDGLNFIQSDVTVNPGNSGGPLVDDKGAVVGMTESGFRFAGAPANLNLFTPVGDALDFLSASPE